MAREAQMIMVMTVHKNSSQSRRKSLKKKTERKGKNKTSQPSEDKKGRKNDEVWERIDQHQNILQEILRKLEAISERQVIPAQRS